MLWSSTVLDPHTLNTNPLFFTPGVLYDEYSSILVAKFAPIVFEQFQSLVTEINYRTLRNRMCTANAASLYFGRSWTVFRLTGHNRKIQIRVRNPEHMLGAILLRILEFFGAIVVVINHLCRAMRRLTDL